jgi:hypothetical protein
MVALDRRNRRLRGGVQLAARPIPEAARNARTPGEPAAWIDPKSYSDACTHRQTERAPRICRWPGAHLGMRRHRGFDLGWINIGAASQDHVGEPVAEIEM